MIDLDALPRVKRATARLRAGRWWGTGYLVARDMIATCYHVVRDLPAGARVECILGDLEHETIGASVKLVDKAGDIAVLYLERAATAEPLPLDGALPDNLWAWGYPVFTAGKGASMEARVFDRETLTSEGVRTFALYSDQLTGRTTESIGGFSGSPVLAGGRVVGHLSSVLGSSDAGRAPHLGQAFAVRSFGVARLLGAPLAAPPTPGPAVSARACVFVEIDAAASAGEVSSALSHAQPDAITEAAQLYAAERLIAVGEVHDAIRLLEALPETDARQQHLAVALSLSGEHARAASLLAGVEPTGVEPTSHALAVQGGVLKRRWLATNKRMWLQASYDFYARGYALDRYHYSGVNAAFCLRALGRDADSGQLAAELIVTLEEIPTRDAWQEASLAEARLLGRDIAGARRQYTQATQMQIGAWRNLAIIRRQARAGLDLLGQPPGSFDAIFGVPGVAAFTGHRVDDEGGRFPPSRVDAVRERICETIAARGIQFGYCSAAAGSDLLFIQALLDAGAEAHVYLPFPAEYFAEISVGPAWRARFDAILAALGSRVETLEAHLPPDQPAAFRRCNEALQAAARAQASRLDESPILIAVVDSAGTATEGGTMDAVAQWEQRGGELVIVPPR